MHTDPAQPNLIDGGTPTPEEARLGAQLATIGDNPTEEPQDTPPADPAAPPAGEQPPAEGATTAAEPPAQETPPADPAPPVAAAPQPTPPAPQPQAPEPPRDFEAAYADNQAKFDSGEIDAEEFQKALRSINREEAQFLARLEIFNERQQSAAQQAQTDFAAAAQAWEAKHSDFMANPLYAQAMQQAINAIEARTPGLAPADLLAQAEKAAFQFTHYTPPAPPDPKAAEDARRKAIADAAAGRKPPPAPATLGTVPTAAHVDAPTGSPFANLDAMSVDERENALARMRPEDVERYLADAPGANSTGHE